MRGEIFIPYIEPCLLTESFERLKCVEGIVADTPPLCFVYVARKPVDNRINIR